jgi:hypothetical protein
MYILEGEFESGHNNHRGRGRGVGSVSESGSSTTILSKAVGVGASFVCLDLPFWTVVKPSAEVLGLGFVVWVAVLMSRCSFWRAWIFV